MKQQAFNMDCMELMKQYPDKYFDLAVVDPPYGIGIDGRKTMGLRKKWQGSYQNKKHAIKTWDEKPPQKEYFDELFRVCKNYIIWGGNYFCSNFHRIENLVIWDKMCENTSFSDFELAFTSFKMANIKIQIPIQKESQNRIHPTQKPVALYDWIFSKYLLEGGKVIDTHGGSMSSLISAIKSGNIEMVITELDKDYYNDAKKRVQEFISQGDFFIPQFDIFWDDTQSR